ncbi:hypothetical protein MIJ3_00275 [Pseudomonas phage vB_PaeM_MIJ3]|nr:hypothetical protein MIJ3_00275 [Pseudomonas phage vB_PaeM_MIJ3]
MKYDFILHISNNTNCIIFDTSITFVGNKGIFFYKIIPIHLHSMCNFPYIDNSWSNYISLPIIIQYYTNKLVYLPSIILFRQNKSNISADTVFRTNML